MSSSRRKVPRVEDEVTSSRNGTGRTQFNKGNIDGAKSSKASPVEDEVTSSHAYGTGSTQFNKRNVAATATAGKRGFQHVTKTKKTNSSMRVHAAHNMTLKCGVARSKMSRRRDIKKRQKILCLTNIPESVSHSLQPRFLKENLVFFSGTSNRCLPNAPKECVILSAKDDLQVIDTKRGAELRSKSGDMVFILLPRHQSVGDMTRVNTILKSLYALDKAKVKADTRGKKRVAVPEDVGKYATVGLKPIRFRKQGSPGVGEFWPESLSKDDREQILMLMKRVEHTASRYLPPNDLRGIRAAKLLGEWSELNVGASQPPIYGSLASALNYYLNSHTDEDFFYSVMTVASATGLQKDVDRYDMDAKVCNYFTFAEQGIAVALRPGDVLLFNPQYQHCLSSRTTLYKNADVFSLSLCLKTAIVGKNDNSLPLTQTEFQHCHATSMCAMGVCATNVN